MDISLFDNKIADLKEEYTNITQQQRTKLVELQNKIDSLESSTGAGTSGKKEESIIYFAVCKNNRF